MSDYIERTAGGQSFTGSDVQIFRAAAIASALRLYADTGMRVNRAYTPRAMMTAAAEITGRKFKARDYAGAAAALLECVEAAKHAPRREGAGASTMPGHADRA